MYKPAKMRLNKFVDVAIPKNSDYFLRLNGNFPNIPNGAYTGDDIVPQPERKVDVLADMAEYDRMMQRQEYAESLKEHKDS